MIQLTDKVWAVEVPDKVAQVTIDPACSELLWWSYEGIMNGHDLPPGSWRFLFTTKPATEEDARTVVRELPVGARWMNYNGDYPVWYYTGKESLKSLLRSKGLDDKNNYAIIEKLSNDEIQ